MSKVPKIKNVSWVSTSGGGGAGGGREGTEGKGLEWTIRARSALEFVISCSFALKSARRHVTVVCFLQIFPLISPSRPPKTESGRGRERSFAGLHLGFQKKRAQQMKSLVFFALLHICSNVVNSCAAQTVLKPCSPPACPETLTLTNTQGIIGVTP